MVKERFVLIAIVVLGISCVLAAPYFVPGVEHLLEKMGETLVIAFLLAVTVDVYIKNQLTRDIVREVSPFIMGSHLPQEIRNEIYELVKLAVYRSDYELVYEITPDSESEDVVWVRTRTRFRLNNANDHPEPFLHTLILQEIDTPGRLLNVGARGVKGENGEQGDYEVPEAEMESLTRFERQWKRKVYIPAHAVGESAAFFWTETIQRLDAQNEITHYSLAANIGLRVVVSYPQNMEVEVTFGHRLHRNVHSFPKDRPSTWELRAAFLPMAAVTIEWKKLSSDVDTTAAITQSSDVKPEAGLDKSTELLPD
ncbi:MAG: hypothetical protein ABIS20_14390 [Thermoanaerobaculia bacterium]